MEIVFVLKNKKESEFPHIGKGFEISLFLKIWLILYLDLGSFDWCFLKINYESYWNLTTGCLSDDRKYKIGRNFRLGLRLKDYLKILYLSQRFTMSNICASIFNNTTSNVFWITGTQIAVPEITMAALKEEGIEKPWYIFKFSKDYLNSVFESLQNPPGKVVNNKVVIVAPHVMSENSRKRIAVTAEATQYYAQFGRDITPTNMHWKTLINSEIQWNGLKNIKNQDDPEVPKLTKKCSIIKCAESFKLNLNSIVGVRKFLLIYAVREQHDLLGVTLGTLLPDQPYSKELGLVKVEMISLTSHDHPLFRN